MEFLEDVSTIIGIIGGILAILAFFGLTRWSQVRGEPKEQNKSQTDEDSSNVFSPASTSLIGETKKESPSSINILWITIFVLSPLYGVLSSYYLRNSPDTNFLTILFFFSFPSIVIGNRSPQWFIALLLGGLSAFITFMTTILIDPLERDHFGENIPALLLISAFGAIISLVMYAITKVIVKREL